MTAQYDEKDWGLEIERCDDGDLLLRQGDCCGCGDDVVVRLHRCHFPLIAEYLDVMTREQFDNATGRLYDRLAVMGSLVRAHTKPGDPLRIVVDDLTGDGSGKPLPSPLAAPSVPLGDECLPNVAGRADEPAEASLF